MQAPLVRLDVADLEEQGFVWPAIRDGVMSLSHAQFEALFAGLDWRRVRALTNPYHARPQWLADVHAALDAAVAEAYGWDAEISQDEALRDL